MDLFAIPAVGLDFSKQTLPKGSNKIWDGSFSPHVSWFWRMVDDAVLRPDCSSLRIKIEC
ncbi:uncharacterized protein EAF01_005812 [Botrytis porri]|uniref:Uncharacterized protein n=1 Tax=Botrytis porri TaxID=87229 RepID=A0A4Z1L5R0_9HELO|nr:uncharacterized protein EAF01_005812 [Botrytis porri]KAF7905291.1 hypothetical protein EAF01_005812 [Botrytis porri]TGO92190.1 hypothetical protein BPOR_0008g00300 [Botrytis porri]